MSKPFALTAQSFYDIISDYPQCKRIWVAYSGGMDSHVLLHALQEISPRLVNVKINAIHVDHGLNKKSRQWSAHCQQICENYAIPIELSHVDAKHKKGESPEDVARQARYNAFAEIVEKDDYIITAHHQDDQAETLLIQLARGSGPAGLASMPKISRFHCGWLARPLLGFSRDQLVAYAKNANLKWIEDPSNINVEFDRNYLRHKVLPVLKARWPKIATTISRSAQYSADASLLLTQLAEIDLQAIQTAQANTLSICALLSLDEPRRNNAIRTWIKNLGFPLPHATHLDHINKDVLAAKVDAQPRVDWEGCTIRRHQNTLYAMAPLPSHDNTKTYLWDTQTPLTITGIGTLTTSRTQGVGLKKECLKIHACDHLEIRFRRGGERCQPMGRAHTHTVKSLFQEFNIPVWMRERIPLIYINGTLASIVGYCYCQGFEAAENEAGIEIAVNNG